MIQPYGLLLLFHVFWYLFSILEAYYTTKCFSFCVLACLYRRADVQYSSFNQTNSDNNFESDTFRTVRNVYNSRNHTISNHVTIDKGFTMGKPTLRDLPINSEYNICSNLTFLFLLIPIPVFKLELRNVFRRYMKQGMVIKERIVNFAFVIAYEESDIITRNIIEPERQKYRDIIISYHKDHYINITLSVLDGFMYVSLHCDQAKYVGKADQDSFIQLGNLIHYLKKLSGHRVYAGSSTVYYYRRRSYTNYPYFVPDDCLIERRLVFVDGPLILVSRDLVPVIVVGWQYEPVLTSADDLNIGGIMMTFGIRIEMQYEYFILQLDTNKTMVLTRNMKRYIVIHNVKKQQDYELLVKSRYPAAYK